MKLLLCVILLLLFSVCSSQLGGSGDGSNGEGGDNEKDDNEDIICLNPLNMSSINSSEDVIFTTYEEGLEHGICMSSCLNELLLLNRTTFQDILSTDYFILSPNIWLNCRLQESLVECSRGCYYRSSGKGNSSLCDSLCFDSCSSDYVCEDCDENICLLGCNMSSLPSLSQNISTPPTLSPLQLVETSSLGLYSVNWTLDDGEEEEERNNSRSFQTLLLNITSVANDESNITTTVYRNMPGLFTELDLRKFICSTVYLSYTWISSGGRYSNSSVVTSLKVKGVNITQPYPVNPITIQKNFSYDYRHGFFGHFVVDVSWINPPEMTSISRYELIIEHAYSYNRCRKGMYDVEPDYNNERTSYIIQAADPDDPPFAHCQYNLKVVSVPVHSSFHAANASWYLTVPTYVPEDPVITCAHTLSPSGLHYIVTLSVKLSPYIAGEEVIDKLSIIPDLIEYNDRGNVIDQDAGALVDFSLENNNTDLEFKLTNGFLPKAESNFKYDLSITFDWLYMIAFKPAIKSYKCSFNPLSPVPGPVTNIQLLGPVLRPTIYSVRVSLSWKRPLSFNGVFKSYQLILVTNPLNDTQELSQSSQIPVMVINEVSRTNATWTPQFIPRSDVHCQYIQIRAHNTYRPGNWSTPLVIPLDNQCLPVSTQLTSSSLIASAELSSTIIPELTTTKLMEESSSYTFSSTTKAVPELSVLSSYTLSSITRPIITASTPSPTTDSSVDPAAMAGVGFGVVVLLVLAGSSCLLCMIWQMRRRKRRLELIQEDMFRDPIFIQMGPRTTVNLISPKENGLFHDDWEIPASMVILECEIGHGEFGEVYKGLITDPTVTPYARKVLKETYSNSVAVKLLKPSATGTERRDFLNEIELMKKISQGHNSHVVNMVGCVTLQEPLCLIIEFVKYGDLLSYLRATRKRVPDDNNPYPDLGDLQSSDLLSFAYQIATGMEFLSSLDIVHRDLACRNVLIGDSKNLKISDYGMSRMVQAGDTYVKSTKGKLPLKWMAIESITDREFTSASDVWAYGVTLWEIGTLGGFPYPTVGNDELLMKLRHGYRMECPDNCSREIYDIMLECWHESPLKRPTFSELRLKVDKLLSAQQSNAYIDLRTDECNDIYTAPPEEEEEEEEEKEQEGETAPLAKRESSHSDTSLSSSANENDPLRASNPLFLEVDSVSRGKSRSPPPLSLASGISPRHETTSLHVSPKASPKPSPMRLTPSPRRPISLALWDSVKENPYVDEPAGGGGGGGGGRSGCTVVPVIRVSASTPSSPNH